MIVNTGAGSTTNGEIADITSSNLALSGGDRTLTKSNLGSLSTNPIDNTSTVDLIASVRVASDDGVEKSKTLNEDLTNYIYRLRDEDRDGIERSNRGGWHSKNFQINETKSVQHKFAMEVQKYILETFVNLGWKTQNTNIQIKEMWAIINKKDDFNVIHTHPNCLLRAAYYVKASKNCGRFQN